MATLHESAARSGAHRWQELAVWQVLGSWAPTTSDPAAAVMFDIHAQHAAWRAAQWWDRLPVLAGIDRDTLVRPASEGSAAVFDELGGLTSTVERAAAAYRVVFPRLAAGYAEDRSSTVPASDGPIRRTLRQVEVDAVADWRAGDSFLHLILDTGAAVDEAAATVGRLERLALGDPAGKAAQRQADHQPEDRHPKGVDRAE